MRGGEEREQKKVEETSRECEGVTNPKSDWGKEIEREGWERKERCEARAGDRSKCGVHTIDKDLFKQTSQVLFHLSISFSDTHRTTTIDFGASNEQPLHLPCPPIFSCLEQTCFVLLCNRVVQCVAVRCSALQCSAVCCVGLLSDLGFIV